MHCTMTIRISYTIEWRMKTIVSMTLFCRPIILLFSVDANQTFSRRCIQKVPQYKREHEGKVKRVSTEQRCCESTHIYETAFHPLDAKNSPRKRSIRREFFTQLTIRAAKTQKAWINKKYVKKRRVHIFISNTRYDKHIKTEWQ